MSAFCPNLSNKLVKQEFEELKSQVGQDLAYYLWDKYEGDYNKALREMEQLLTQALRESIKRVVNDEIQAPESFKQAVDYLFEVRPELAKAGTVEEYMLYMATIYPETTIPTVYWHGTDSDFSDGLNTAVRGKGSGALETGSEMYFNRQPWASLQYISGVNRNLPDKDGFNNWVKLWWTIKEILGNGRMDTDEWKHEIIGPNTRRYHPNKHGIFDRDTGGTHGRYLSERKADYGYENKSDQLFFEEVFGIKYGRETFLEWIDRTRQQFQKIWNDRTVKLGIIPALLNIKNPITESNQNTYYEELRGLFTKAKEYNNDAIVSNLAKNEFGSDVAIVFNTKENVHFLGTNSDIESFKNWKKQKDDLRLPLKKQDVNNRKQNFTPEQFALSQRMSLVLRNLFPEIDVKFVDSIEGGYVGESDLKALQILLNRIAEGIDTEPHEFAHFYVAMFRDTPLVQKGIETFGSEEALVLAIGVRTVDMEAKARTWWLKFVDFVKKLLNKNKYAKKALLAEITDAFLTRSDLGGGESIYNLTGILHLENGLQSKEEKLPITIQLFRNTLLKIASKITFDPVPHLFTSKVTNRVMKSVSAIKEENKYSTYDASDEDPIQLLISQSARDNGTSIHAVFEHMFLGDFNPNNFTNEFSLSALKQIQGIVDLLKSNYDWVASEAMLGDHNKGIAGIADLIMQDKKTKEYVLFDFKTKMTKYNGSTKNEKGKSLNGFTFVTSKRFSLLSQRDGFDFQLSCYNKMMNNEGLDIKRKGIVPITYEVDKGKITAVFVSKFFGKDSSNEEANKVLKKEGYYPIITPDNIRYDVEKKVFGDEDTIDELDKLRGQMIEESRDLIKKIIDRLNISKDILRARGLRNQSNSAQYLLDLIDELQELNAMFKYVEFGIDQLKRINDTIQRFYKKGPEADWNLDYLTLYRDVANSYQMISEITGIVLKYSTLLNEDDVKRIEAACNKLLSLQRNILSAYDSIGSKLYLDAVTPYVRNIEIRYREKFSDEFRENNKKEESETSLAYAEREEAYILKKLEAHKDIIQQETRTFLKQQSQVADSGFECSSIAAAVNSAYESKDPIVIGMIKKFDDSAMRKVHKMLLFKAKLSKILKEFDKKYNRTNTTVYKDIFDDFIEYTEDGQCYLVNPQSGKFIEAYKKAFIEINNNPRLDYQEKIKAREDWLDENCPIYDKEAYNLERQQLYNQYFADITDEKSRNSLLKAVEDNEKQPADKRLTFAQLVKKGKITIETRNFLEDLEFNLHKKYRRPNSAKYQNAKYLKMLALKDSNDPKWLLYKLFLDITDEMDGYMSKGARSLALDYRLPGIIRRGMETVNQDGVKQGISQSLKKDFILQKDDEIRGSFVNEQGLKINQVPHFFHSGVTADEQSFDLPTIYYKWYDSANEWRMKKNLESLVLLTLAILHSRTTQDDSYSLLDKSKGKKTASHKRNTAEQFDNWVDVVFYSNRVEDMGSFQIPFTDIHVDLAKLIRRIIRYSAERVMSVNYVSAINNALVGEANQLEEVFAGEYLSKRSYGKASKLFKLHIPDMLKDFNKPVPDDKLNRLVEYFNIFESQDNLSLKGFLRHSVSDYSLLLTKVGEREMQTRFFIGMLCEALAKDKDGNILGDMLDFIDVNDNMELIIDPKVANFNEALANDFSLLVRRVLMRLHGNYMDWATVGISAKWYGAAGLSLRRWIASNVERRFAKEHEDSITGKRGEGFYRTGAKWLGYLNPLMALIANFVAIHLIHAKNFKSQIVHWHELKDYLKRNVIRFGVELGIIALSYALYTLLGSAGGDDDDEWLAMFRYQSYRLFTDLTFFFLPTSLGKILQDPFPVMGLMTDFSNLFLLIFDPLEEYKAGNHVTDIKLLNMLMRLTPGLKQVGRLENIANELDYFTRGI